MVVSSNKYLTLFMYSVRMIVANGFEVTVRSSLYNKFTKLGTAFRTNLFLLITHESQLLHGGNYQSITSYEKMKKIRYIIKIYSTYNKWIIMFAIFYMKILLFWIIFCKWTFWEWLFENNFCSQYPLTKNNI